MLIYNSSHISNFLELLSSPDVDLRIAVGEAIVCLFEIACENEDLELDNVVDEAVEVMKELSKDSHKYRSKKDKKEQKSSFRDIVHFIEDDEDFYEKCSFGQGELLEIESWVQKIQYDALRKVSSMIFFNMNGLGFSFNVTMQLSAAI